MKRRCSSPKATAYDDYGGRGIKVCDRWLTFENFIKDMGDKPAPDLTVERINNDGNYEPSNCRWASRVEQSSNQRLRRDSFTITHDGETKTLADWSKLTGVSRPALRARIEKCGWSPAQALGFERPPAWKRNLSGLDIGRRSRKLIDYNGESKSLMEWSHALNIKRSTLGERLRHGWSIEDALGTDPLDGRWH